MLNICAYSPDSAREVLTIEQMRAAEQAVIAAGTPGAKLMERAGRAVVREIERRMRKGDAAARAAILCGPGNNGGDGYVVARVLKDRGWDVSLYAFTPRADLTGDARFMADLWDGLVHPSQAFDANKEADVIVDALFGTGLSRDLDKEAKRVIAATSRISSRRPAPGAEAVAQLATGEGRGGQSEQSPAPYVGRNRVWTAPPPAGAGLGARPLLVAVDISSGVNGDTGEVLGAAFDADLTVTFHAMKPGHLLMPGRRHAGEIVVADIGLGPDATRAGRDLAEGPEIVVNDASDIAARIGMDLAGHKYTKGHALVLAGGIEGVGAARLAARAALRVGAGLVTIGAPGSALLAHASRGPDALMLRRSDGPEGFTALLADARRNAIVLGPALGVGEETREAVAMALKAGRSVVLDADAITSFAGDLEGLAALTQASGKAVLTPHQGEFSRLFEAPAMTSMKSAGASKSKRVAEPASQSKVSRLSRLNSALLAAAQLTAVIVLKGPDTIVAAPDGRCAINVNAPPWLGTAGSGDVLAGLIGGLMAQGFSPFESACCGVFLHGGAGQICGRGLIADDLPEGVAQVLGGHAGSA